MKTITLKEAFRILEDASAVIINDDVVLYPSLDMIEGSDENEFLFFRWDDGGLEYTLKFCEGDNQEVKLVGSSMFLYDTDSNGKEDYTQLTILITKELEVVEEEGKEEE
jgi:hypothetical protein